jgi:cytochrome c biogenesis protein CcdA
MSLWSTAPDQRWLPFLKMYFGFLLMVILATIAGIIAIGHVHMESSYGLDIILGGLIALSGGFVQWAFTRHSEGTKDE